MKARERYLYSDSDEETIVELLKEDNTRISTKWIVWKVKLIHTIRDDSGIPIQKEEEMLYIMTIGNWKFLSGQNKPNV